MRAAPPAMHQLRQRIGDNTCAVVMDGQDGIVCPHLPATVYHFLGAALHLCVATLYRTKIQILRVCAGIHAGCRTAAQADEHARPA